MTAGPPFSRELKNWLTSDSSKTLGDLTEVFAEKSFAVSFLILMLFPSLPLPTGGLSHVMEAITMLLSTELILGRKTIWLPKIWQNINLGRPLSGRAVKIIVSRITWIEKFSGRRLSRLASKGWFLSLVGVVIFTFSLAAFLAPPFSGLDTLPALGVVVISLGLILEDVSILTGGILIGSMGIALVLAAGVAIYQGLTHLFH